MGQGPLTVVKSEPLAVVKSEPLPALTAQAPDEGALASSATAIGHAVIGALKGGGQTAVNLGRLLHMIPGVSDAVDALYGEEGRSAVTFAEADRRLAPTNRAQSVGKGLEQIAEAVLPSSTFAKAGVTLGTKLAAKVPALATRMGVEGLAGGATATAQGGSAKDVAIATGVSAAVPGGGTVYRAGKSFLQSFLKQPNQTLADAIAYVAAEGVPIDAATQSGRRAVANMQKRVSESMGGSGIATEFKHQQGEALADLGTRLTREASPGTSATLVSAGDAVTAKLESELTRLDDLATQHYDTLRSIEQRASSTRQVPTITEIDATAAVPTAKTVTAPMQAPAALADAKKALTPIYEKLLKEHKLVPLQGDKGRALVALETIVNGPEYIPLTELDSALGTIKAMARGAELPALRTAGQGVAAEAVKQLERAVSKAAADLGPEAMTALREGRKATIAKYAVQDVRQWLGDLDEPVKVATKLLQSGDAGLRRLQEVAKQAPDQMPEVGQAFLQGLMEKATAEGGFARTDALLADWNRLGAETKKVLFSPALIQRLNHFFLAAKKIGQNPNPSGTANVMTAFNVAITPLTYVLAKAMYGQGKSSIPSMESLIRTTLAGSLATDRAARGR